LASKDELHSEVATVHAEKVGTVNKEAEDKVASQYTEPYPHTQPVLYTFLDTAAVLCK
jgi:hypothetical protein